MTVTYHAGRRLQGLDADRTATQLPAGAVGGWVELGRTTLGSAGDTISVGSLPNKRYYMVLQSLIATGGEISDEFRFNSDSGTNYSWRRSLNGGADGTGTSATFIENGWNDNEHLFDVSYITNSQTSEKLVINHQISQSTAGAGNAPLRAETVGKWANTSSVINTITNNNASAGDFAIGSEMVVLGYDPADTHTTNFWQELHSTTLTSDVSTSNAQFDSGTFTAKKYLWIQMFIDASFDPVIRFNGSSTGYSARGSSNGGADVLDTNTSHIQAGHHICGTNIGFGNIFIINNANNEKLGITHGIRIDTSGAGTAPNYRGENVFKWVNTSDPITSIQVIKSVGTLRAGTRIKVWGAD